MKHAQRLGRAIVAVLFGVCLLGYSVANLWQARAVVGEEASEFRLDDLTGSIEDLDRAMEENVLWRYPFVEGYGALQLLQGKREINGFGVVRDQSGFLHSGNFWSGFGDDQKELALRVRRLQDALAVQGTQVGFVLQPMKVAREDTRFYGIPYNDFTENADNLLRWLRYYEVPYLDLRQTMSESGLSYEETYFRTDHHWTPRASFAGFSAVVEWMNHEWNAMLDPLRKYRNLTRYDTVAYPGRMLGSQGRSAGLIFSGGTEAYEALVPKEGGSFTWEHGARDSLETQNGPFAAALMNLHLEQDNLYDFKAEEIYLNGIDDYDHIENHLLPDAPSVLLLRDSFASPLAAFLSQCCSRLDMLWTQEHSSGEIESYLQQTQYDYVLVMLYPENLNYDCLPFFESEDIE